MEQLTEIAGIIVGALFAGVAAWGISVLKARFDLDPDGQVLMSLELWQDKAVDWVVDYARDKGEDLEIPEARWALVNKALDWLIPEIPKLMDFFGYDKEKIATEVEQLVKKKLREVSS